MKFQPGQSGNPKGRPKGSRNKLGEEFVRALAENFKENGVAAIQKVCDERPAEYLKIIAGVLPKDINLNVNEFEHLSDEQLADRIRELYRLVGPFLADAGTHSDDDRSEETTRH